MIVNIVSSTFFSYNTGCFGWLCNFPGECDASAVSLRKYLVEALVRPGPMEDAQHLALRLLSQALDAATLLSASALAPKVETPKAPVEIFAKYVT